MPEPNITRMKADLAGRHANERDIQHELITWNPMMNQREPIIWPYGPLAHLTQDRFWMRELANNGSFRQDIFATVNTDLEVANQLFSDIANVPDATNAMEVGEDINAQRIGSPQHAMEDDQNLHEVLAGQDEGKNLKPTHAIAVTHPRMKSSNLVGSPHIQHLVNFHFEKKWK